MTNVKDRTIEECKNCDMCGVVIDSHIEWCPICGRRNI